MLRWLVVLLVRIVWVGGLAQSEECVVSNDEAPGSKPGFSKINMLHPVRFELTPPKRIELESIALDHSAMNAVLTLMVSRHYGRVVKALD